MGFKYYDKNTGSYVPMSIELLKSDGVSYTAPSIKQTFEDILKQVSSVSSSVIEKVDGLSNQIGNIDDFHITGTNLVEKILNALIQRRVSVTDFGAKGDGVTDDTAAFNKAFEMGYAEVFVPAGTYMVKGLKVPSYTRLYGTGKLSVIKLHKDAPAYSHVITTVQNSKYIIFENLLLDWNLQKTNNSISSGPNSSCLNITNSQFVWVNNVHAKDAGLHGFDVTSPSYNSLTDTEDVYQPGGSKYVWINNCTATNFGDDGFTTHFSEYIFITNCYSYDGNGSAHKLGTSNTNGFEIDDGSMKVWLINCVSKNNCRGFEAKAHEHAPAAQNVTFLNCVSENDIRSFDFRHIGFHKASNPESKTARNIMASNCTAIKPIFNDRLYVGMTPRALVISAYKNVNISNFTAIGDPSYDYKGNPAIATQYKSRNITFNNVSSSGFKTAGADIYIYGGSQKSDFVSLSNINVLESALIGIRIGSAIKNASVNQASLIGYSKEGSIGLYCTNSQVDINAVNCDKYAIPSKIAGKAYTSFVPKNIKGGTRIATTSGYAAKNTSLVAASSGGGQATGTASAVIATTGGSKADGPRNVVIASSGGSKTTSEGSRSMVAASNNSSIEGTGSSRMVIASQGVANKTGYTVALGYAATGAPSTANTKIQLDAKNGNINLTGQVKGASTFSDYAEYFESIDGKAIPSGYFVTLEGDKIRKANAGDKVLGVISETAGVVLGEAAFNWQGRYLKNEFGGLIYEDIDVTVTNEDGTQRIETKTVAKENPYYEPSEDYIARSDRPEWNIVGMFGQIFVRIDGTVAAGDRIIPKAGKGSKSEDGSGYYVMRITTPYSQERGYGVALCLITPTI